MCGGVVCLTLLADGSGAMTKTVPHRVRRSRGAARFGQDGEIVIRGTFKLLALDEAVAEAVKQLKARDFKSPYLKAFVVARVTRSAIAANAGSARSFWRALRYAANRETDLLIQSGTHSI